jgi:adenosylcobinamide-GDP ribazoletransferase
MLAAFKESAARENAAAFLLVLFSASAGCLLWLSLTAGAFMVLAALACLLILRRMAQKKFNGMSGDLAGWFLQTAELVMLAALIVTEKVVAL